MMEWLWEWFAAVDWITFFVVFFLWGLFYGTVRSLIRSLSSHRRGAVMENPDPYALMKLEADNQELRDKLAIYESPDSVEARLLRLERHAGINGYRDAPPMRVDELDSFPFDDESDEFEIDHETGEFGSKKMDV